MGNYYIPEISALIVSFILTLVVTPVVIRMCKLRGLYDLPNSRKMHKTAIPRLGGVVFLPCMIAGFATGLSCEYGGVNKSLDINISTIGMASGAIIIYMIGVLDDIKEMRALNKFMIQLFAAMIFPFCNLIINDRHGLFGLHEIPFILSYPFTVFVILLIVNAMNLIDGIDGLSSGLAAIILCVFGVLYAQLNAITFSALSFGLAGAVIAFFIYNMFGKVGGYKVFMGDSGSLLIGYVIAYLAIKYQMSNGIVLPYRENSLLISYTLLIIPTFDLVRVALSRLFMRKGIFTPDKTHIHHCIMQTGVSMRLTLVIIISLFILFCLTNLALYFNDIDITIIAFVDIFIYALFVFIIKKFKANNPNTSVCQN